MSIAESLLMFARFFSIRTALIALWLAVVGAGFAVTLDYQNTGGSVGRLPQQWPAGTRIVPDATRDTLVMFAHPRCPCTRASIEELNRLMAHAQGRVAVQVYFFKPGDASDDWLKTDLWRSTAAMPGVAVHADLDGIEARRFGAETSGFVLLFDTQGHLLFQGGITASRGHAGDNAGENDILSLLMEKQAGPPVALAKTPVYGCSLLNKVCQREDSAK
jgi:hypothetical protein